MAAVAFVGFDGFYAASLLRKEPGQAVAVVRARRVLDASPAARKFGVKPGISAAEGRYAAHGRVRFVNYREEDYLEDSRRWLDICAEYATVIEPIEPGAAFLDLSSLPGARELAVPLAADIYSALRLCPRIGIAGGGLAARLAGEAIFEGGDAAFLATLPIESLWRARPEHLRRLRFLGYRTIGEVAQLPMELLIRQFGQDGLQISLWARGIDTTPVRALYPPDELSSRFYFPQPARLDSEIEAGLRVLSTRLGSVLVARDKQVSRIELEVGFSERRVSVERAFTKPMQSSGALLTGLRLTLRKASLDAEISYLFARLPVVEDAGRKQLALAVEGRDLSAGEVAMKKLQDVFGRDAIKPAASLSPTRREMLLQVYERSGFTQSSQSIAKGDYSVASTKGRLRECGGGHLPKIRGSQSLASAPNDNSGGYMVEEERSKHVTASALPGGIPASTLPPESRL